MHTASNIVHFLYIRPKLHKQHKEHIGHNLHNSMYVACCDSYDTAESSLNIHEEERMKPENWFPVAWFPIYDNDKSKRPTQGYECNAARAMRLHHDCWRLFLDCFLKNSQHPRNVVYGDRTRHQTRSYIGGLLGDQQVRMCSYKVFCHIICIRGIFCINNIKCIIYMFGNNQNLYAGV